MRLLQKILFSFCRIDGQPSLDRDTKVKLESRLKHITNEPVVIP